MLTGPTLSQPSAHRASSGILRIFFATSPITAALVLICLLLGGLAESIGLASFLPVLSVAAGNPKGGNSALENMIRDAFSAVGLPTDLSILLLVVIVGLWAKAALSVAGMDYVARQVAQIATGLRLDLIDRLLNVRWSYFLRQPIGRFTNAMSGEAARAAEAYQSAATVVSLIVQTAVYLVLSLLVSWQVSLISLAVGAIITLSLNRLIRTARRAGRNQTRRTQALVQRLSDTLTGIKPLKAMAKHVRLSALFATDAQALNKALRRQFVSKQALRSLQEPLLATFLCAGVYIAVVQVQMPIAEFFVLSALLTKIVLTINKAQQSYQMAVLAESAFWGLRDMIAEAEAERELSTGTKEPSLTRGCVFERVTFGYGDKIVLRDASFAIDAGRITAITGASGAGKTTLADLLLGLHRPQSGEIRIDDLSLTEIDLTSWREMAGYVPQEVILFHDSVLANVTLGDPDYGRADAQAALEAAGAWDFVAQLPDGLDTIVGERGALLSGGQRQRIAVARALIHRPALLILDEATSALDPDTEASICRNLRELSERTGLTILAISHQPAWVETADRVYQLGRGQVSEAGDSGVRAVV